MSKREKTMHDTVIRSGTIVDGTGAPSFTGDVAIKDGKIASVGGKAGPGKREIDANGLLVTPGWVDVHTHYDGQATWDSELAPSSWHGVTTVLFGNCGVGFAPVRRADHASLIGMMESIDGTGRHFQNSSTRWTACRARSTSRRKFRTTRCGFM
jgi:N-acyl-D-amino-acid deacylase